MEQTKPFKKDGSGVERGNGIYSIEVGGTPYEMGVQHGELLRDQIRESVADYKTNVVKLFGQADADRIFDWVLNVADFRSSIETHLPHVLEEMGGIADGAGLPFDDVLLSNMFEEVYEAAPLMLGLQGMAGAIQGCTSFTAFAAGKRFSGQNMDYSSNLRGKQLLIHYKPPGKPMLLYGFVGQVGGIGVNQKGLSVFVNTLPQGAARESDGLGSAFICRMLLEQSSAADALEKLTAAPRFSGNNFVITDHHTGMVVECDADQAIPRVQTEAQRAVVATNHALHLNFRRDIPGLFRDGEPIRSTIFLSIERMEFAQRMLHAAGDTLKVDDLKVLLTVTPVNFFNYAFETLQSCIVELDGDQLRMVASAGFDPLREWNVYTFDQ